MGRHPSKTLQTAAILQELYGDNPDTMQKAADIMWGAMANAGLITQDEMRAGQLNAAAQGFRDAASFQAWANGKGYTEAEIQNIVQANSQGGNWTGGQQAAAGTISFGGKTYDPDKMTALEWKNFFEQGNPATVQNLVTSGKIKDISKTPPDTGGMLRTRDFSNWAQSIGLTPEDYDAQNSYEPGASKDDWKITVKKPTFITYNGKYYQVVSYTSTMFAGGDRQGGLQLLNLETGQLENHKSKMVDVSSNPFR
jgi:hypothetical protein